MLIEIKVKVARNIDNRTRKRTETYLINKEFFSEAEYQIMSNLNEESNSKLIEEYEVQSLRISPIKEVAFQNEGDFTFIATLKDIWLETDGTEKQLKYKVLLWAKNLTEANTKAQQLAKQGYDMQIEGLKQVDYEYLNSNITEEEINND